jgi:hypothetical protein
LEKESHCDAQYNVPTTSPLEPPSDAPAGSPVLLLGSAVPDGAADETVADAIVMLGSIAEGEGSDSPVRKCEKGLPPRCFPAPPRAGIAEGAAATRDVAAIAKKIVPNFMSYKRNSRK